MNDAEEPTPDEIPIADLSEEARRPRRRTRRRVVMAAVAALLVAGGVATAFAVSNDGAGPKRSVTSDTSHGKPALDARLVVGDAVRATTATGSFDITYSFGAKAGSTPPTTAIPPCALPAVSPGATAGNDIGAPACAGGPTPCPPIPLPSGANPSVGSTYACGGSASCPANVACTYIGTAGGPTDVTISGTGTVNVNPTAMVTTSDVPGLGAITTRVDANDVWEYGGGNYGATSGGAGPGQPLAGFASLVEETLGPRAGAIAMTNLASPTHYLDVAAQSITSASFVGDATVGGVPVKQYSVGIDTMRALDAPNLSAQESLAISEALKLLASDGYRSTTVVLSIDADGLIRAGHTTVSFADGGTVVGDTTFSNFGCSTVVMQADGPNIVPNPQGCAPTPTTVPATSTSTGPGPTSDSSSAPTTAVVPAPTSFVSPPASTGGCGRTIPTASCVVSPPASDGPPPTTPAVAVPPSPATTSIP